MTWARRILDSIRSGSKKFRRRHFERREEFRSDYELLSDSLLRWLDFDSVIDIGCANAFLLAAFHDAGKTASGVEVSEEVLEVLRPDIRPLVKIGDFSEASAVSDLVCCVEIAEHIPPERSRTLVRKLSNLAERWIFFTAAPPGQGGRGHINCREHREWLDWFGHEGWSLDEDLTAAIKGDLEKLDKAWWLRANCMVLGHKQ